MKASSGMQGYGNAQCVSSVTKELGSISLYGHNQHYNDYDVAEILSSPITLEEYNRLTNDCTTLLTSNQELVQELEELRKNA